MNPCVIPTSSEDRDGDARKLSMHERFVHEAKTSEPEVLFIGDSIIEQLQFSTLWIEKISSLHCINFGIGGDRVENVLWRIQNGELDFNVQLKAVVLFVGTNNINNSPQDIFEGILECVKEIKRKLGDVFIILPTLLPKGQYPNPFRKKNQEVNKLLHTIVDDNIIIVKIDENIIQNDGTISHHDLHDYLHLTNPAYTKIFGPVYEKLCELLKK